jgi:hypothetical protein
LRSPSWPFPRGYGLALKASSCDHLLHAWRRPLQFFGATIASLVAKKTEKEMQTSFEAHKGDFDDLLGEWEFYSLERTWERKGLLDGRASRHRTDPR